MRFTTNIAVVVLTGALLVACDRSAPANQEQPLTEKSATPKSAPIDSSSATPATGASRVDPVKREKILSMLGGFEHVPGASDLYGVEPDMDSLRAILLDIYTDDAVKKGSRQRALALVQHAKGDATLVFYERIMSSASTSDAERRIAIKAYGAVAGERGEEPLIALLDHDDSHTRGVAATELGELGTQRSIAALEARAEVETKAHVRKRIGKALGRDIGAAPAPGKTPPEVR